MRNISKHNFLDEVVLLNSIIDIHCSTAEEGAGQNWMAVDVGPLSGLRKLLATKGSLKKMKNVFYFTSKAFFVLKIFKFLY